jgi:hypothetical protein
MKVFGDTVQQFEAAAAAARRGLGGAKVCDLLTLKCN